MTLYSLLKPFKWPYPIIPNIPDSLLDILDSPVPILIGINKGMDFFQEYQLDKKYKNVLFVCLDNEVAFFNHKQFFEIYNAMPSLGNLKQRLKGTYEEINTNLVKSKGFVAKLLKQTKFQPKKGEVCSLNSNYMIYSPTKSEIESCKRIFSMIKETFHAFIIQKLPRTPKFLNKSKGLIDFEDLEMNIAISKNLDSKFLSLFLKTQIFTYFIEEYYGIS